MRLFVAMIAAAVVSATPSLASADGPALVGPSLVVVASPAGTPPADTTPPDTTPPVVDNDFIPTEQDVSDCVGVLQRPNCGSEGRGGWRMLTVMGLLAAGLGFIGWRVVRGVKARDAIANRP